MCNKIIYRFESAYIYIMICIYSNYSGVFLIGNRRQNEQVNFNTSTTILVFNSQYILF